LGRRAGALTAFVAAALAVAAVVAVSLHAHLPFGLSANSSRPPRIAGPTGPTGRPKPPAATRTVTVTALGSLSAPASRIAAVPYGTGGALFLGGYDATAAPTDAIENFQAATVTAAGTLPVPDASAGAAVLGSNIYLLGGTSSTIYELNGQSFTVAGSLPSATADAAVATVGDSAYVIGGYTGSSELDTIVAYTPGLGTRSVATLPVTLRYPAAVSLRGQIYIIGGSTAGVPSATVYRYDPTTNAVAPFTTLPHARERESAAVLDGLIYAIGGANAAGQRSRAIYSINPASGRVALAGILPQALADTTAVSGDGQIIVAGGTDEALAPVATIYAVTPIAP
jgi:N-acetylneuraminic acid mutarotase